MKLNAVVFFFLILVRRRGTGVGARRNNATLGRFSHKIAVAHPTSRFLWHVFKESAAFCFQRALSVLASAARYRSAVHIRQQLATVTNAENGNSEFQYFFRQNRRALFRDRTRTARKNYANRFELFELFKLCVIRQKLAINAAFAHPARY